MEQQTIVRGRWVVSGATAEDTVIDDGAVLVEGGVVRAVGGWGELRARAPEAPVLGSDAVAVLPGLINAHHHAGGTSALQQGLADDLLEPWILAHARLRAGDPHLDVLVSAARLLASGVTSVVDVHSGRGSAEQYGERLERALCAYDESGIRVAFAPGIRNRSWLVHGEGEDERFIASLPPEARAAAEAELPGPDHVTEDEFLALVEEQWRGWRLHPRIDVWLAPPGPQWVSDDFLLRIAELADRLDTGIQTHALESLYEKLHGAREWGRSTIAHLADLGVLSRRFSIAHGVWLGEDDVRRLADTHAAVVHNPGSNLRLRAGVAPLNALLEAGVTVALGMDGTTLGDDEDMFAEMRLAARLHRTPTVGGPAPAPGHVLAMATAGGARLLRDEARLGRLAEGYAADLVLVRLERITWPWTAPEADPRALLLMRAAARDVDRVMIDGEVVWAQGRPTRFDAEAAGRALAERLSAQAFPGAAAQRIAALRPHLEAWYAGWETPPLEPWAAFNSRR